MFAVALFLGAIATGARGGTIPAAAPGMVEIGPPAFVVLGSESIGLSSIPTDVHLLPDGRLLAVSQREIAFGDGVRWEVFRSADEQTFISALVAVDGDGRIYTGTKGGMARIDLGEDGHWRFTPVSELPREAGLQNTTMFSVTMTPADWYWHDGSGAIVAWQPGKSARVIGNFNSIEKVFTLGQTTFVSDHSTGSLFRLVADGGIAKQTSATDSLSSETVVSTTPYEPGTLLIGTSLDGLKLFDGTAFRSFEASGFLGGGHRISDLCAAGEGFFAAAVDTVGIVFFDRNGRTIQVLDRSLDHRLARVRRLQYASNGVLWALLTDGVARVEFPSQISRFEPILASGLHYARPVRHAGRLWMMADGQAMRGIYDDSGRLERFGADSPPGRYVFMLADTDGQLFATNETGIYLREPAGWKLAASGIVNARIGVAPKTAHGLLYVARGEFGFLQQTADGFTVHRIPVPALGDSYNAIQDSNGVVWFELGTGHVARVDPNAGQPALRILGPAEGLTDRWVETYLLDGTALFHMSGRNLLFRFDDQTQRFVSAVEVLARFPFLATTEGRPTQDAHGRLWYIGSGTEMLVANTTGARQPPESVKVGFSPTECTVEDNGVAWMFANLKLARYDPAMPQPQPRLPQAAITSVQFPASGRNLFNPGGTLDPVRYVDNSLVIRFAAPANPFVGSVEFEVMLEGAGTQWVSTGTIGSASFNRLKEGNYVFRVRPVTGGRKGGEAQVAFTVRPPWFRTPLAWFIYVATALGLFGFAAWFSAFLQRRENERLEHLVAIRTEELNTTNRQLGRQIEETTEKSVALAASEERYRMLNTELERRVQERTAQLSLSNDELQQRESLFRLIYEHAPVGISWKRADLGDVYHFNPTFRRILGISLDAPTDYTLLEKLVHPEDAARQARMNGLIASGGKDSYNIEQRFVLGDGTVVWTALSVAVVRDKQGRIVQDIGILENITARKQAELELAATYKNLVDTSRMAGMAEIATGVLHNVGNALNSLNVSSNLIVNNVRQSRVDTLVKISDLLRERAADIGDFLARDPKGRLIPELLAQLALHAVSERDNLLQEVSSMQESVDHIKAIVAMQQSYATVLGVVETLEASSLFEDTLRMNSAALVRHDITVVREYLPAPLVCVEKGKVLQILINLIRNAKCACVDAHMPAGAQKLLIVRVEPGPDHSVRLIVRDNGVGIPPENLIRIFSHGFTTREYGHGFGLHSSALAAKGMKGSLTASSDGVGKGAAFILEIPSVESPVSPGLSSANALPVPSAPSAGA